MSNPLFSLNFPISNDLTKKSSKLKSRIIRMKSHGSEKNKSSEENKFSFLMREISFLIDQFFHDSSLLPLRISFIDGEMHTEYVFFTNICTFWNIESFIHLYIKKKKTKIKNQRFIALHTNTTLLNTQYVYCYTSVPITAVFYDVFNFREKKSISYFKSLLSFSFQVKGEYPGEIILWKHTSETFSAIPRNFLNFHIFLKNSWKSWNLFFFKCNWSFADIPGNSAKIHVEIFRKNTEI